MLGRKYTLFDVYIKNIETYKLKVPDITSNNTQIKGGEYIISHAECRAIVEHLSKELFSASSEPERKACEFIEEATATNNIWTDGPLFQWLISHNK